MSQPKLVFFTRFNLPIQEVTFPTVTLCPSKNSCTNINYDLMMIEERNQAMKKSQGLVDRFALYFQGHIMSSCH